MSAVLIPLFILLTSLCLEKTRADFSSTRRNVLANEALQLLGSTIQLSEKEEKVNNVLMTFKLKEYDESFKDPSKFLPSKHFFHSKTDIEKSDVYKFVRMLPKGASLHSHFSASLSLERFLNLTHYEHLYGCNKTGNFQLRFITNFTDDDCDWKPLREWRSRDDQFDHFLKSQMSLVVDDPANTYKTINDVWDRFEEIFTFTEPLFDGQELTEDYLYELLEEYYEDNVIYLEIRLGPNPTYDSKGTRYNIPEVVESLYNISEEFKKTHPGFIGLRLINTFSRRIDKRRMEQKIAQFLQLQEQFPNFIAGFDLVGQEDEEYPLSAFTDQLLNIAHKTKFFFHAGETNQYGTASDRNLIDAVLFNTSRIGHGFAIVKHPEVMRIVKEKQIAIEISPISNQVLKLVGDLRNHVGVSLIANGYPVVITSDDPGFWGAKGLSYDWYMAFMAMTPRDGDLKILKQLAINSLIFSSLSEAEKVEALTVFDEKWNSFLDKIIETYKVTITN